MTCTRMADHSTDVMWHYVVPPENTRRMSIMQRQDGPFRSDEIGGCGHYYVSEEVFNLRILRWDHVEGSACGGFHSFSEAYAVAERKWVHKLAEHLPSI